MKSLRYYFFLVGLASLLALGATPLGLAGGVADHDRARKAVEAGEVLPLRTVLERLEREYPGQIMEVELERKGERWVYEIKLLRPGGALLKLKVDARNGVPLDSKASEADGGSRQEGKH